MSKKDKEIVIPLSKIIPLALIILIVFQQCFWNKKEKDEIQSDTSAVAVKSKSKQKPAKISKMNFDDVSKTLAQFAPNLSQSCDTVKWQKGEIIRHFSIDTALQRKTEMLTKRAKTKYGAAVAMNPKTGQILALVSQFDAAEQPKIAENLCLSNKFPAASIIKIITAEAAFENLNDITPATLKPFVGKSTTLYKNQFFPEKYGGDTDSASIAEAFAKSNNSVFARLAVHSIGRENLAKSAQKFGWNSNIPFEMPVAVSIFPETNSENENDTINLAELGSGFNTETSLTPLLGALAVSAIINNGSMMTPILIDSITDISGRKLYSAKAKKWKNAVAADIADSLKILMRETTKSGSARNAFVDMKRFSDGENISFGGKTGTKDSELGRNEWFVGFAKDNKNDFAVAVSICFVQYPKFVLRPSQVSADIMLEYLRKTRKQINENN